MLHQTKKFNPGPRLKIFFPLHVQHEHDLYYRARVDTETIQSAYILADISPSPRSNRGL